MLPAEFVPSEEVLDQLFVLSAESSLRNLEFPSRSPNHIGHLWMERL
jgi:hypothetical protein